MMYCWKQKPRSNSVCKFQHKLNHHPVNPFFRLLAEGVHPFFQLLFESAVWKGRAFCIFVAAFSSASATLIFTFFSVLCRKSKTVFFLVLIDVFHKVLLKQLVFFKLQELPVIWLIFRVEMRCSPWLAWADEFWKLLNEFAMRNLHQTKSYEFKPLLKSNFVAPLRS